MDSAGPVSPGLRTGMSLDQATALGLQSRARWSEYGRASGLFALSNTEFLFILINLKLIM